VDTQVKWWSILPEPALDQLIVRAQANSPDLKAMAANLRQAQAMARVAGAARVPSLSLGVSGAGQPYTPFALPVPGFDPDPDTEVQTTLQAQFNLAYEADLFGRVRASALASQLDAGAAAHDLDAMRLVHAAQIVELVLTVLEGREQLALLKTNEGLLRQRLSAVQERYRSGLSNLLEIRQQEELIATSIAQRPLLEEQVRSAGRKLALLSGQHAGKPLYPKGQVVPELPARWMGSIPASFVHRRPDVSSAFKRVHAADHRLAAAIAGRLPSLRFSAQTGLGVLGRSRAESPMGEAQTLGASLEEGLGELRDDPAGNLAWSLSAQLLQPIYQGGAVQARVGAAEAAREASVQRYIKTVLTAYEEVMGGHAGEEAQRLYLSRLSEQRAALLSSLEAARKRYTAGLTEYRVLLQTQLALLRADQALIRARRQVWSGRMRLLRAAAGPLNEVTP
jgi:NodT family efflux transporter outer membrane factor (OMF) lipoprotein